MKKIFSTKMINIGGRNGEVHSPDKSFNLDIVAPGRKVEGATNPEQLFAAGYSLSLIHISFICIWCTNS